MDGSENFVTVPFQTADIMACAKIIAAFHAPREQARPVV
jgi:hypothetical protein